MNVEEKKRIQNMLKKPSKNTVYLQTDVNQFDNNYTISQSQQFNNSAYNN